MSRGRRLRRVVLVLTVAAAVAVMHALSLTGAGHHGSGSSGSSTSAMVAGADGPSGHASRHGAGHRARHGDVPANRPATPEPVSHWLSMSVCAFAVLIATRLLRRVAGPRRRVPVPAHDPAVRLVVGPEPPVP